MKNTFLEKLDNAKTIKLKKGVLANVLIKDDAIWTIKKSFNELTKRDYFPSIVKELFFFLVDFPGYVNEELLYLLTTREKLLHLLSPKQLGELLQYLPGFYEVVLDRFDELNLKNQQLVNNLAGYASQDEDKLLNLAEKIFNSYCIEGIRHFIRYLASNNKVADYSIFKPLIENSLIKSLPSILSEYSYLDDRLRNFLVDHFEMLFALEKSKKMGFLENLKYDLPEEIEEKYRYLLKLFFASNVPMETCGRLNILLEYQQEDFIKEYIGDNDVSFIKAGSAAQAFKIGEDKVLKLSKIKHTWDSIYEHFLLAPTVRNVIRNSSGRPCLYVEKQNYLLQEYNGIPINSEDFDHYFEELERQKLRIYDPHCVRRYTDNFGFLKDYHDATLVGVTDHEELPDWFKKRPMVLLDIDMVKKIK